MNRVQTNEYKGVPYRARGHGSWIEEWPFHQGCNEKISFAGFLTELFNADQEYFVRYMILKRNASRMQLVKIVLTDLSSGDSFFYEKEEFISMDEVGTVRTNSSMVVPDFKHSSLFLHARTEGFSMRFHMMTDQAPIWADVNPCEKGKLDGKSVQANKRYTWNNLDARGTLFFHQKDGKAKKVRCMGNMWFYKEFGPRKEIGVIVRPEWISVQFLESKEMVNQLGKFL